MSAEPIEPITEENPSPVDVGDTAVLRLGRGGMAEVYLAVARGPAGFNKLVVVKKLLPALADDEGFREMFLDEARLAARLNHPNVVQTYEVGEDGGRYFIAMEYLEGPAAHTRCSAGARTRERACRVGWRCASSRDALAGLHYAHELRDYDGTPLGIVHRDVSPQNIFVTYDGQVKLRRLRHREGRAHVDADARRHPQGQGRVHGARAVARPAVDRRADVFAMGDRALGDARRPSAVRRGQRGAHAEEARLRGDPAAVERGARGRRAARRGRHARPRARSRRALRDRARDETGGRRGVRAPRPRAPGPRTGRVGRLRRRAEGGPATDRHPARRQPGCRVAPPAARCRASADQAHRPAQRVDRLAEPARRRRPHGAPAGPARPGRIRPRPHARKLGVAG